MCASVITVGSRVNGQVVQWFKGDSDEETQWTMVEVRRKRRLGFDKNVTKTRLRRNYHYWSSIYSTGVYRNWITSVNI